MRSFARESRNVDCGLPDILVMIVAYHPFDYLPLCVLIIDIENKKVRESMLDRFRRSAEITSDNWRDPQHDLDAIRLASAEERDAIERFLIARGVRHFMDVEALALLGTETARDKLIAAFREENAEIRAAVAYVAPDLIAVEERLLELLQRVECCDAYQGLDLTLHQIESEHPPAVIDAMLKRIIRDPGVAAVHFVAMLYYLFGIAKEAFDWEHRPFFLRFNPGDDNDRRAAFAEACQRIGRDPAEFQQHWDLSPQN